MEKTQTADYFIVPGGGAEGGGTSLNIRGTGLLKIGVPLFWITTNKHKMIVTFTVAVPSENPKPSTLKTLNPKTPNPKHSKNQTLNPWAW